jgi:hypothetical protein
LVCPEVYRGSTKGLYYYLSIHCGCAFLWHASSRRRDEANAMAGHGPGGHLPQPCACVVLFLSLACSSSSRRGMRHDRDGTYNSSKQLSLPRANGHDAPVLPSSQQADAHLQSNNVNVFTAFTPCTLKTMRWIAVRGIPSTPVSQRLRKPGVRHAIYPDRAGVAQLDLGSAMA